jgi:hypothetical protein
MKRVTYLSVRSWQFLRSLEERGLERLNDNRSQKRQERECC